MHLSTQRAENLCHLIILADYRKKGKQLPYKVFPFCGHFVLSKNQYFRLRYCFANTSAVTEMPAHTPYKIRLSAAVLPALFLSKFIWGIFSMLCMAAVRRLAFLCRMGMSQGSAKLRCYRMEAPCLPLPLRSSSAYDLPCSYCP